MTVAKLKIVTVIGTRPEIIRLSRAHGADRTLRLVSDYATPNVSDKVVRIIHSHPDYVKRVVWRTNR
jgi:UDP-N-acetylglucosamine 2-epimerase